MGCKLIEEEDQDEFFVVIALHILFCFICVCVCVSERESNSKLMCQWELSGENGDQMMVERVESHP